MLRPPHRRSRAALQSIESSDSVRTILIALAANVVIAIAKLISGLISGSTALLAEAAHSLADASNEVFLGISLRRAAVPADDLHPMGHGRERFLWAFLAAIASFLIGGCFSVAIAIRQLARGDVTRDATVAWIVLAVAFVADGVSWVQSMRQAHNEAKERGRDVWLHLLRSSDPTVRAVVVEDSAALIGLVIAAVGLLLSQQLGSGRPDAIASMLIGLLMAATAFGLGRPLADFLVGKSLPPDLLEEIRSTIASDKAIEEILSVQAVYIGPEEVIVAAKVRPSPRLTAEELSRAMDNVDHALRRASPFVADVYIDVTSHNAGELHNNEKKESAMAKDFVATASTTIKAPVAKVWDALIDPEKIKRYMFGTNVRSNFKEGSPITWKGEWEGKAYEDKGKILQVKPERLLRYSHFSPLSGLPDKPENYHTISIELSSQRDQTVVSLSQDKNATEEEREHSEKNWTMMLASLKKLLEQPVERKTS